MIRPRCFRGLRCSAELPFEGLERPRPVLEDIAHLGGADLAGAGTPQRLDRLEKDVLADYHCHGEPGGLVRAALLRKDASNSRTTQASSAATRQHFAGDVLRGGAGDVGGER